MNLEDLHELDDPAGFVPDDELRSGAARANYNGSAATLNPTGGSTWVLTVQMGAGYTATSSSSLASWSPFSRPCWRTRLASAEPSLVRCTSEKQMLSVRLPRTMRPLSTSRPVKAI